MRTVLLKLRRPVRTWDAHEEERLCKSVASIGTDWNLIRALYFPDKTCATLRKRWELIEFNARFQSGDRCPECGILAKGHTCAMSKACRVTTYEDTERAVIKGNEMCDKQLFSCFANQSFIQ